jgi:ATP-dependent Clp protease ATP-binding subunit ClpX
MLAVAPEVKSKALDLYLASEAVVGQELARKQLASLLERQWQVSEGVYPRATAALLSGRSGTGKTMTARLMCEHLGLAYSEADATRYTESGYKGLDLQHMFLGLIEAAARMKDESLESRHAALGQEPKRTPNVIKREDILELVEVAQNGVILLDEFDKWMLRMNHVTGEKDKAIQAELLKMIEGTVEYVTATDDEVGIPFDTSRVLIICAGAFVGLFQQVARRLGLEDVERQAYLQQESFWQQIVPEDFERFGLLPELAGRLSRHIFTRPLTIDSMRSILTRPGGLLEEYRARYEAYGVEWRIGDSAIIKMTEAAMRLSTGARALDHVVDKLLGGELLFEASVSERPLALILTPEMPRALLVAA